MKRSLIVLAAVVFSMAFAGSPGPAAQCVSGVSLPGNGPAARPAFHSPFYDTTYSFPTPSTWPVGLTWDGTGFWVMDIDTACIFKLDTTGAVLKSFPVPPPRTASGDLAFVGQHLWAVSENTAWLYKLDTTTGAALDSFRLPDSLSPDGSSWGLSWDGHHLWHSQYGDTARIFLLDTADGHAIFSCPPPPGSFTLGIAWDGHYLWCVDAFGGGIYQMNPPDSSIVAHYPWPIPYALGLQWVGANLWNVSGCTRSGGTTRVYKIEGLTGLAQGSAPEPVPQERAGATIRRCGTYSDLVDATGRRVTNPGPGVYFTKELSAGECRFRPVVVVR